MQSAGLVEGFLRGAESGGEGVEHAGGNAQRGRNGGKSAADGGDAGLAAHAATRGGDQMTAKLGEVHFDFLRQGHIDDVARAFGIRVRAGGDFHDVLAAADDALGEEEAGDEVAVVAGGSHEGDDGLAGEADFQWLLDGDGVGFLPRGIPGLPGREGDGVGGFGIHLSDSECRHGTLLAAPPYGLSCGQAISTSFRLLPWGGTPQQRGAATVFPR